MKHISVVITLCIIITIISSACTLINQNNTESNIEQLRALPYLTHTKEKADLDKMGVTVHNAELACPGYFIYENLLLDMKGDEIYNFSGGSIEILQNGNYISVCKDKEIEHLCKFTWDHKEIWKRNITIHHEVSLTDENTILILTNEVQNYNERLVEFDVIIEFNSEGKIIDRWSTWENFDSIKEHHEPTILDQPPYVEVPKKIVQGQISSPFGGEYDYYHLNSVQSIPANPNGVIDSRFKAGNWLISLRNVNVIAIISKDTREIVWSWKTGGSVGQHTTRMLENGNILFFENGGQTRNNYSRVIELNPVDKRIVWIYKGDPLKTFYSETEGSAQRLPNGNTLITESAKGRAFEITPKREIVWEWYNPDINEKGQRKTIHRMTRYSKEKIDILLEDEKRFHR